MAEFYNTGTLSVDNGATAVTGTGVLWDGVLPGDTLELAGQRVTLAAVPTTGTLTLAAAWTGADQTDAAYVIRYDAPQRFTVAYLATQVRALTDKARILEAAAPTYAVIALTDTPPGSPVSGDMYAIGDTPTGAWAGQAGNLAQWTGAVWQITVPDVGWLAYALGDGLYVADGGWQAIP